MSDTADAMYYMNAVGNQMGLRNWWLEQRGPFKLIGNDYGTEHFMRREIQNSTASQRMMRILSEWQSEQKSGFAALQEMLAKEGR